MVNVYGLGGDINQWACGNLNAVIRISVERYVLLF